MLERLPDRPEWHKMRDESEKEGPIVSKIRNKLLQPTDFSPSGYLTTQIDKLEEEIDVSKKEHSMIILSADKKKSLGL